MKIKVSEATPLQLNYLVAKCEGYDSFMVGKNAAYYSPAHGALVYALYSTKWEQGGPIIERELIRVIAPTVHGVDWVARIKQPLLSNMNGWFEKSAPTPLIAAMRCYVASKLGDEIEIPEELK